MFRVFKSQAGRNLADGFSFGQLVFGLKDAVAADIVAGAVSGHLSDEIAEVMGRHAKGLGEIGNARQLVFGKLPVVKTHAEI